MAQYMQMVGGGLSAAGAWQQGTQQGNALDTSANIQTTNARLAEEAGQFNAQKQQMMAGKKIGLEEANFGASGVKSSSGSVLDVLAASHATAELDRLNILHGADIRAISYKNQAAMDEIGAQSAYQGRYLNVATSLLGSGSKSFGYGAGADTAYAGGDAGEEFDRGRAQPSEYASVSASDPSWRYASNSSSWQFTDAG